MISSSKTTPIVLSLSLVSSCAFAIDPPQEVNQDLTVSDELEVRLTVPVNVVIEKLGNIDLVSTTTQLGAESIEPFCIGVNTGATYSVKVDGNGAGGAYTLSQGQSVLPYQVTFTNDDSVSTVLTAGQSLTGQVAKQNTDCTIESVALGVSVTEQAIADAETGLYSGEMTLTVIVE